MENKDRVKRIAEIMAELEGLGVDVKTEKAKASVVETIGTGISKQVVGEEGLVIEAADTGRGFALYADTAKLDKAKFKRLTR